MENLLCFLGDNSLPYRTIMSNHRDFLINGHLIRKNRVVIAEQIHSCNIHLCAAEDSGAGFDAHPQITGCDAMISNIPYQFLMIRTADCPPVLIFDKNTNSIGAVHSGREGTRNNIAGKTIISMKDKFSSNPKDLSVWVGPGICKKHYPVSSETWHEFAIDIRKENFCINDSDFPYLDTRNLIIQQILATGVDIKNIHSISSCTYESDNFFSYRRDGSINRQINVIGMLNGKHNL